jgi:DUF4097 and DUF4098 domain-containing protein YvlB
MIMRPILFATAAVLAVTPVAIRAQSDDSRQKIDTTFAFEKNGVVDLGHVSGDIVVTGWTKTEVKIYATIETGYLESSLSSSRVRINARSRYGRMGRSRYELSVPIGTEVRASSVSGNVTVRGVAGAVNAKSVSGDVEVRDADTSVDIESVSGDVRASKLRGRVRAHSVSGDVRIDDLDGDLSAKTVSGEIEVTGAVSNFESESVSGDVTFTGDVKNGGMFRANSHSGDLRLALPPSLAATFELQTFSGSVQTAFPITIQPGDQRGGRGHRLSGAVNGGGPRISLATFSGNINIDKGASRPNKEN